MASNNRKYSTMQVQSCSLPSSSLSLSLSISLSLARRRRRKGAGGGEGGGERGRGEERVGRGSSVLYIGAGGPCPSDSLSRSLSLIPPPSAPLSPPHLLPLHLSCSTSQSLSSPSLSPSLPLQLSFTPHLSRPVNFSLRHYLSRSNFLGEQALHGWSYSSAGCSV